MLLFNTILPVVLLTGIAMWRQSGERVGLYLGLCAIPLWIWAYAIFGSLYV